MKNYATLDIDFSPLVNEVNSFLTESVVQSLNKNPALIYGHIKDITSSNEFTSFNELSSVHKLNVQAMYYSMVFGWLDNPNFCLNAYDTIIIPYKKAETYNCNFYELKPNAMMIERADVPNPVRNMYLGSMCNLFEVASLAKPIIVRAGAIHNIKTTSELPDTGEFLTLLIPAGQNDSYFS